jgi:OOP family OmpA-OmpF porin
MEEVMKQHKKARLCGAVTKLTMVAGIMFAGFSLPSAADWYGAVDLGQTDLQEDVCGDLTALGFTPCSEDKTDTGWKLAVGNQFNANAALEFGYADLGEAKFNAAGVGCSLEANGFHASLVGSLPMANQFSFTGRVGLFSWDADVSCSAGGASASADESGTDLTFGVGVRYDMTKSVGLRGGWERFDLDDADVDLLSLGLIFSFK